MFTSRTGVFIWWNTPQNENRWTTAACNNVDDCIQVQKWATLICHTRDKDSIRYPRKGAQGEFWGFWLRFYSLIWWVVLKCAHFVKSHWAELNFILFKQKNYILQFMLRQTLLNFIHKIKLQVVAWVTELKRLQFHFSLLNIAWVHPTPGAFPLPTMHTHVDPQPAYPSSAPALPVWTGSPHALGALVGRERVWKGVGSTDPEQVVPSALHGWRRPTAGGSLAAWVQGQ